MGTSLTRREFLGTGATAGMLLAGGLGRSTFAADEGTVFPAKLADVRIHKVFVGRTGGIYLSRPQAEIEKFNQYLAKLEGKLPGVKFVGGELIPPAKVPDMAAKFKGADGVLLFHLSGHGGGTFHVVCAALAPAAALSGISATAETKTST